MSQDLARELEIHKRITGWRILFGVALMAFGVFVRIPLVGPFITVVGAFTCARAFGRLVRIQTAQRNMDWYRTYVDFNRSALPRQLFLLLLGVAEVDGRPGHAERDLVQPVAEEADRARKPERGEARVTSKEDVRVLPDSLR